MLRPGASAERGLSLAEVMLALGLAAATLLVMMITFTGGLRLLSHSEDTAEAAGVARQIMERILARDYLFRGTDVTFDGGPAVRGFPPSPYPQITLRHTYKIKVTLTHLDAFRNHVQVDLSWPPNHSLHVEAINLR